MPKTWALIVAGGKGVRMGGNTPKQYLPLQGRPVLSHTLEPFLLCESVDALILAVPGKDFRFVEKDILKSLRINKKLFLVPGGESRQESVANGLERIREEGADKSDLVAVHDGVRPLISKKRIEAVIRIANLTGAAILGVAALDTMKKVNEKAEISETLERSRIFHAQTPQVFNWEIIVHAYAHAKEKGITGTDDAFLVEKTGQTVTLVPGDRTNIKITQPDDLLLADFFLSSRQ